jgi:hypothetical protein
MTLKTAGWRAAARVHDRHQAGSAQRIMLDGHWHRIRDTRREPAPPDPDLSQEDRDVRSLTGGGTERIRIITGRAGRDRRENLFWPGEVALIDDEAAH